MLNQDNCGLEGWKARRAPRIASPKRKPAIFFVFSTIIYYEVAQAFLFPLNRKTQKFIVS